MSARSELYAPPKDGWREDAACHPASRPEGVTRAEWTAVFFPQRGDSTARAREVCARCPVRDRCLLEADGLPREREGIWGGLSGRQRRRLRQGGRVGGSGHHSYPPEVRAYALRLVARGMSYNEAAGHIGASPKT